MAAPAPLNAIVSVDNMGENMGDARVRVAHLSPDAPAVDVWVNGTPAFTNLGFEEFTDYAELPAGTYNVKVEPAGANGAGPFVIDADLDLSGNTDYTVVATGTLAEISPVVLIDDNSAPAAGSAKVRFFHGSADAPGVDIALAGGAVLFGDVLFQSAGDYIEVPAGTYDLEARPAGTLINVLNIPGLTLEAGKVYTAWATGLLADGSADRTLYVNDDRFRVEVSWTDFDGNSGIGWQNPLTADTGYFWFFDHNNVEIVVKALDGTSINGNYWVFYGSLTNVEFTLTVTDTMTGEVKTYSNAVGEFASFGDTAAFTGI
jgi:hypothetical protein